MAKIKESTELRTKIGFNPETGENEYDEASLIEYLNIKLRSRGSPIYGNEDDFPFLKMGGALLRSVAEKNRLLKSYLCPIDQRIQNYLEDLFKDFDMDRKTWVPTNAMVLERHGMARTLSLPPNSDKFESDIVSSYRVKQGILNNPKADRRTTKGVFHVAEGGLPIADDKKQVPLSVFAKLLDAALQPPEKLLELPFTSHQEDKACTFVSLMLRPLVGPSVLGVAEEKRMEVRFFAPGNLVSNLDFVESIFGNAGDPFLVENDSALDVKHWSGHTGCVILAPHLNKMKKKDLGLPHISEATERQKRDSMCWESEDECYNNGGSFKITSRDSRGVVVTLISDNYYGYCKKEVKTQLSYAANLMGNVEEEHAGGAIGFASYDLGEDFRLSSYVREVDSTFKELQTSLGDSVEVFEEGYATDNTYGCIRYVPEDAHFTLHDQKVTWEKGGSSQSIQLQPDVTYVMPSGYRVQMIRPNENRRWRLIGTSARATYCHKPCTVSGGGKSEISKSLMDAIVVGPVFTADIQTDFDIVEEIVNKDFGGRFVDASLNESNPRPLLSEERSLGSVIKLLSPSDEYTREYSDWLAGIPGYVIDIVLVVKRFYKSDWGADWRNRFSVDVVNGKPGNELKYRDQKLLSQYLRVGFEEDGSWRIFSLRKDFFPASKIQTEDDISASIIVPATHVKGLDKDVGLDRSLKFIVNCEYRLFQRPDEAIHRGYDKTTESDFSRNAVFFSNYQQLERETTQEMEGDAIRFGNYTEPMQRVLREFNKEESPKYVISSSDPRLVDGKPTKNPRYLQNRLDMEDGKSVYLAGVCSKLYRKLDKSIDAVFPVDAVLPGRRNNPPEKNVRALAVYNPIHYQELPEAFMDFIASLTGKSPSTTGAGSEGALTKGPFNALLPVVDINNALVSYLVSGYECFTTSAGCIGPKFKVDHDISLLVPEIWCRMKPFERKAAYMEEQGYLDKLEDFEFEGEVVEASRLGSRINSRFVQNFGGRIFSNPQSVFPDFILKPEVQDLACYVDGIKNIVETQRSVALNYFKDGSIDDACPPIKAILHIMAYGEFEGKKIDDPAIRELFTYENMINSEWYQKRLDMKQLNECRLWKRHLDYLEAHLEDPLYADAVEPDSETSLREVIKERLSTFESSEYREKLNGCIGVDPSLYK
ncbi:hypothetical protein MLD52_03115 [Puniceicoccaceae bacterium K14]|nr:hypothetical protein [Puniceicoccaceae bacterium K14]